MFMKINRRNLVIIFAVLSILLVVCITYYLFTKDLKEKFSEETSTYLGEIANQSVVALQNQINGEIRTMKDISSFIGKNETINRAEIMPILTKISENNHFKRMGIILPNGKAYTTDQHEINLADRAYFKNALNGQASISDTIVDKIDGKKVHVYSAPIYHEDKIIGVVFAAHKVDIYQKILSISTFNNEGHSFIAKSNGDLLIKSTHPNRNIHLNNLAELTDIEGLDTVNKEASAQDSIHNMGLMKKGTVKIISDKNNSEYVNYTPLNINDWYLISFVPVKTISEKTTYITQNLLFIYSIIIGVYSSLLIYVIFTQKKNKKELSTLAYVDTLTGARNINKFYMDAQKLLCENKHLNYSIMQFDIDKFKFINDMYGFEKGNTILKYIASTLEENLTSKEIYARIQPDHFVVLLTYEDEDHLLDKIKEIYGKICRIDEGNQNPFNLIFSCGIYVVDDRSLEISAMIDRANIARKTIKGHHQSSYAFYDNKIREKYVEEKEIENIMYAALHNKEFVIYLQPKYELKENTIIGAEALVRWQHPEKGLIPPIKFIPLFERNGFIVDLDYYVFEETCRTIRRWLDEGITPVPVSVNMSRLHLLESNFVKVLHDITRKYQVPASLIEIELTENIFFDNPDTILTIMQELQKFGFLISLDDFGTGYSSLNLLKDVPVDVLKLDRVFFTQSNEIERGEKVVSGVVTMAKDLAIKIVSEGVETEEQVSFLKQIGCDMAQGFYFAKPMPIKEFEELTYKNGLKK
ncbi:bifunctional diguanylate cyclase/phosphodiesterase [Bacillus massiliigorillae]|uniref:bifunctional diguanylate cyclase/phosphodiesterase n=1 Tax=Bacillus massiliigorillae TaxID=1243664 RepID=UPI0005A929AF|nr:EAL domain-containing protein [Bacillus massiliigorillae]